MDRYSFDVGRSHPFPHAGLSRRFPHVAEQMHHRLAELAPHEREEVEHASKLLRRARAATPLPVITHPSSHGETG